MNTKIKADSFVISTKKIRSIDCSAVGLVKAINGTYAIVFFVGQNELCRVSFDDIQLLDIEKTGKGFDVKICNICHILKPIEDFEINQTDAQGKKTRRPSCRKCRENIDGVGLLLSEKKRMDEIKPPKHSIFTCPICEKRTIVGITANLVRDHNHSNGMGRQWICDSCNTGLGRFKDNINFLEKVIAYLKSFDESP